MKRISTYFAYGSNTDLAGMLHRAPGARPVGPAVLEGWQLMFDIVAGIVLRADGRVFGGLWHVSARNLKALDHYEGEGTSYDRRLLTVRDADGREVSAWTYILRDPVLTPTSTPYFRSIERGYRSFGLPFESLGRAVCEARGARF